MPPKSQIPTTPMLARFASEPKNWVGLPGASEIPAPVAARLAGLVLLEGLPFTSMVPDDGLLPMDSPAPGDSTDNGPMGSIQFFQVDPNWIAALRDGAMSLGRTATVDKAHDDALSPCADSTAVHGAATVRSGYLGAFAGDLPDSGIPVAGFLMRSPVVEHWPGLEVEAYRDIAGTQPANTLRMEKLSPSVLLCLFDSAFLRVDFKEPAEGIHFSVDESAPGTAPTKGLRNLGVNGNIGESIQPTMNVTIPFRGDASNRVVNVQALEATMTTDLINGNDNGSYWDASKPFTSAEFAIQMLEGASIASFQASSTAAPVPPPTVTLAKVASLQQEGHAAINDFIAGEIAR